jgi:pyruvate-formate lyase
LDLIKVPNYTSIGIKILKGFYMQLEQISYSNYKERILKMREKVVNQPHEICIERAKLFTESYKKSKGESPIIRFAKAMEHFLTNMTIKIWDDEVIVGNRTTKLVGTPLYPEVRIDKLSKIITHMIVA